jgi:uncharacterized protein
MQLEHSFTVPVPVEVAWQALHDPERVAPCLPGATLTSVDGSEFSGTVKVRLGPVSLTYKGTGRFTSSDEDARRLVLEATGKDSRGNGTASATITATVAEAGDDASRVDVVTDLTITGRPAQLSRGLIGEVSGKILDAFAECLASKLTSAASDGDGAGGAQPDGAGGAQPPAPERPRPPEPDGGEIDLMQYAGGSVAKRLAPLAVGALVLLAIVRWLRRR